MEKIIEANHINKKFGKFKALNDINLALEKGKIYGIIGPNGAGKSTTLSTIMGLVLPSSGHGSIKGHYFGSVEAKAIIGYVPEFPSFYSDMSCLEYLVYMGQLANLSYDESLTSSLKWVREFDLQEHMLKKVTKFSTGMKKKVGLIQALLANPEILLLDEPTANLDPTSRYEIILTLKKLVKQKEMTILISSHVLTELETIIDHVIMINKGSVIINQPLDIVLNQFNLKHVLVSCSNNEALIAYLKDNDFHFALEDNVIRLMVEDKVVCKKKIVKFVYENDYDLKLLQDDHISLDKLYQRFMEGKE